MMEIIHRFVGLLNLSHWISDNFKVYDKNSKEEYGDALTDSVDLDITKTRLFKYIENFISKN